MAQKPWHLPAWFKRLWLETLKYEGGKARTATEVDMGNFRGSRCVTKNKMLKISIFAKDRDANNNFTA